MKVLIVDDSGLVGERLMTLLDRVEGLELLPQAFDAAQASLAFGLHLPEVVLLDLHLPGETCLRLLREIKTRAPSTRAIVLTARPDQRYRKPCMDAGAEFFLWKGADIPRLVAILTELAG
ncbi:MAG: response regulator transcription factor [Thermoanaerobaculia bacterium]